MVLIKSVFLAATVATGESAVPQNKKGSEQKCFGPRMHKIDYDISNFDKDGTAEDFTIKVTAQPEESDKCPKTNGELTKAICVGVNTADCTKAAESIKINDFLSCENCFLGLTSDLYLDMEVSKLKLQSVSMGIKNTHVRGAVEVQAHAEAHETVAKGTYPIVTREMEQHIDFVAGGVLPIDITFRLPTDLSYEVTLDAEATVLVGGDVDVNLGDHSLKWTKADGFTQEHSTVNWDSVSWTPVLQGEAHASAEVPLGLTSTLEVEIEKFLRYNLHINPAMPLHAKWASSEADKICVSGDASLDVRHDADLHFEFAGYEKTLAKFLDQDIYNHQWPNIFDECITIPTSVVV